MNLKVNDIVKMRKHSTLKDEYRGKVGVVKELNKFSCAVQFNGSPIHTMVLHTDIDRILPKKSSSENKI